MALSAIRLFWTQRQIDQVISGCWDLSRRVIPSSEPSCHIWDYFEVNLFILEGAHCSASEFICPWCVWTCLWSLGQACQGMCPPNPLLIFHSKRLAMALISPWPVCGWGRCGAKTSALLSVELQEIASKSWSSHFPWDKLLCVLCGFTSDCTATDPTVATSVNNLASWVSLFSQCYLQAL